MISTTSPENKKEKLKELIKFHQPTFDEIGVPDAYFVPKLAYKPQGFNEKVVTFFKSEVLKGVDVYLEFCDSSNNPEDPQRVLYKWNYNRFYETEYKIVGPPDNPRYAVPVSELVVIKINSPELKIQEKYNPEAAKYNSPFIDDDTPLSEMTIRDLAAILLKEPVSNKEWLNRLIKK